MLERLFAGCKKPVLCSTLLFTFQAFFQATSINSPTKQTRKNFKLQKKLTFVQKARNHDKRRDDKKQPTKDGQ
jgi:hypothetical protein